MTTALDAIETLDLRLSWAKGWTLECRAAKASGTGATIAEAAAAAWAPLASYLAALDAMPDSALRAPALRERALLRALRAVCVDLGAK